MTRLAERISTARHGKITSDHGSVLPPPTVLLYSKVTQHNPNNQGWKEKKNPPMHNPPLMMPLDLVRRVQPQRLEHPPAIIPDADPGTELSELARPLIQPDLHVQVRLRGHLPVPVRSGEGETGRESREGDRGAQTRRPAADDGHAEGEGVFVPFRSSARVAHIADFGLLRIRGKRSERSERISRTSKIENIYIYIYIYISISKNPENAAIEF
jgi:hypothetical protein